MHVIKKKPQKIVSICLFLVFASLVTLMRYNQFSSLGKYPSFMLEKNIKQNDIPWTYNLTGGGGIYIDDSIIAINWSNSVTYYDWIEGDGTLGSPYEIKNVWFDGESRTMNLITIKNSQAYFRIKDCILINTGNYDWDEDYDNAIYLENVENGIISNVNTSECMNGIRLVNSNYSRILGNFARNNYYAGIVVSGGSNNRIRNNTISEGIGIKLLDGTYNNDVLDNIITPGTYTPYYPYTAEGIILSGSYYNNITFNIISDCEQSPGISLSASDYNNVSGNTVRDSGFGLKIYHSDNNVISANSFLNSTNPWYDLGELVLEYADYGFGLHISDSSRNNISKNNVIDNQIIGIYIENSDNHSIWENTITNSGFDDIHLINTLAIDLALNEMNSSGLYFDIPYSALADINIETSNLVNGKPIYFYINRSGLGQSDFINAGQIFLYDCNDIVISGLEFDLVTTGITLENCFNSTISSNEASDNNRWAFNISRSNYNRILNNDVIRSSIVLEDSNHSKLIGNTASYSKTDGISLENCHNNYISGNTANYNNEIGIRLYITNHGLIHNNIANNNNETGISVSGKYDYWDPDNCINNTLTSNEANDNGQYGIIILYINDVVVSGNTAKRNIEGITLDNFESGIITENEVTSNTHGLTVRSGSEAYVSNNTVISNGEFWGMSYLEIQRGEGILIYDCHRVEVNGNVINRNAQGIVISGCTTGEVKYNHLSENGREASFLFFINTPTGDHGILIISSTYINVTGNILNDNGIGVSGGGNNRLFLNQITGFGFIIIGSHGNIISGNLITGALIAIDLDHSHFNNITFNIIIAQQCFREKNNCTANVFENNDCTEVLPEFYLREIVSIIGLASVLGLNIPLFLKKRKERK